MHPSDVSDNVSPSTRGGSHHHEVRLESLTGRFPKGNQFIKMRRNVRATSVAGWSEKRGMGEYLLVVILVLSTILLVPIALDMPDTADTLTVSKFSALLDQKLAENIKPVVGQVKIIEEKLETEVSEREAREEQRRAAASSIHVALGASAKPRLCLPSFC